MKSTATPARAVGRLHLHAVFAIAVMTAACGDGGSSAASHDHSLQAKAALAMRSDVQVPVTAPVSEDGHPGASASPGRIDGLAAKRPAIAYVSECIVDFTDSGALQLSEPSLWFDRVYLPWFQQCGGLGYVDIRPMVMEHFHLGFADADVMPCYTDAQAYPSRIAENGFCNKVDIPSEPRTHVTTHTGAEIMRITAEQADYTTRAAFDLNRIRIPGTEPVRLCYKKRAEASPGSWISNGNDGSSPGAWLCWNQLGPGTWDLSDWVRDVMEVKVTGTPGVAVNFSLDDLHVGIR